MFYYTCHPGDLLRERLPQCCSVMLVASSCWDDRRRRFDIRRPPADWVASMTVDSGGFTAAKRWGTYPWTLEQYVEFVRQVTRDVPLDFCAAMDYACERGVDRSCLVTNAARIKQGLRNEMALRAMAPDLPWLGVNQGNTLNERRRDVRLRRRLGLPTAKLGVGSICGRKAPEAAATLRYLHALLPESRFHAFGLDWRAVDGRDDVALMLDSIDSYGWTWPHGERGKSRPAHLHRRPGERWSSYVGRVGAEYQAHVVLRRITVPRQLPLVEVPA